MAVEAIGPVTRSYVTEMAPEKTTVPPPAPAPAEEGSFGRPRSTSELIAEGIKMKAVTEEQLAEILEKLNRIFDVMSTELRFKVHEGTKDIVVQVIEIETGKVLREIPPERILDMITQMMKLVGLLVDEKA
ncbi:MAG: flagellar protein FlaG [Bacillota bacterium]|nr:flagellar protein FlaG [Bacillota bacterium]